MKSKDLAIIIGVAFVSAILSYVVSGLIFGGESSENLEAPIVQKITDDFAETDPKYFNANSINPTQLIIIGEDNNNQPF